MATLLIDEIRDEDVADVIALWQACGLTRPWNDPHNDIAFARAKPTSTLLVGRETEDGPIAASLMVGHDGHRGWCYYVSVSPDYRGKGFGKAIMKGAEHWLLEQGVWKAHVMVRTGNETVTRFYETLGYNISETQLLERWIDPAKRGDAKDSKSADGESAPT